MAGSNRVFSVPLNERGTFTLPKAFRSKLPKGTILIFRQRDDGVIEIQPRILTDPSQAWFWSADWQKRESEAEADRQAGRVHEFADVESFLDALHAQK